MSAMVGIVFNQQIFDAFEDEQRFMENEVDFVIAFHCASEIGRMMVGCDHQKEIGGIPYLMFKQRIFVDHQMR